MLKAVSSYALVLSLSLSLLGPTFLTLLDNRVDIEIVQDIEEESQNESNGEFEEFNKFLNDLTTDSSMTEESRRLSSFFYSERPYGHISDIHSPPPDYL